jgi:hypothetical protein
LPAPQMVDAKTALIARAQNGGWSCARSAFSLARVVVGAFGRFERHGALGAWQLWVGALAGLWLYERRVHTSGKAVCLLGMRRRSVAFGTVALVVVAGLLGATSALAVEGLAVVVVLTFLPFAWRGVREMPARVRLSAVTPAGPNIYLHSFASVERGAGAELLRQVCKDADDAGAPLALDASAPRLVEYYRTFGFLVCGNPVRFPDGNELQRMWRPPELGSRFGEVPPVGQAEGEGDATAPRS